MKYYRIVTKGGEGIINFPSINPNSIYHRSITEEQNSLFEFSSCFFLMLSFLFDDWMCCLALYRCFWLPDSILCNPGIKDTDWMCVLCVSNRTGFYFYDGLLLVLVPELSWKESCKNWNGPHSQCSKQAYYEWQLSVMPIKASEMNNCYPYSRSLILSNQL